MNWIKQNPFLSALVGGTIVVCGLLAFLAINGGSKYEKAKADYKSAYEQVQKFEKLPTYPNKDNSPAKEKAVDEYRDAINDLSGLYTKYQLDPSKQITTQKFTENVVAATAEVSKAFGVGNEEGVAKTKLPENFFMGFEAYKGQLAKSGSTALLDYQLNAIKHILLGMAENRPSELIRIYRERIPEEDDKVFEVQKNQVARKFGYEIVFKGNEASVRDFITKLGKKENYFCVIRSIRINNERDTPPKVSDAKFETPRPASPADPFGAFFPDAAAPAPTPAPAPAAPVAPGTTAPAAPAPPAVAPGAAVAPTPVAPAPALGEGAIEGAAPAPPAADGAAPFPPADPAPAQPGLAPVAPAAATDTSRVLYQVLGDEELQVFVRFDILLFLPKKESAKP